MSLRTFGNAWQGDGLWNLRIGFQGIEPSFCFLARDTVPVNRIRYFNCWNSEKVGYHSGTGGTILIQLRKPVPGVEWIPGNEVLAVGMVENPLARPKQLLVEFNKTAVLEAGNYYHIVFTNVDPDPTVNYVSLNAMATMLPAEVGKKRFPERERSDLVICYRDSANLAWRRWRPELEIVPIFTLLYSLSTQDADGVAVPGYGGMESWVQFPRSIAGKQLVRQVFTPVKDQIIHHMAVRLAKRGNPGDLTATLNGPGINSRSVVSARRIKPVNITAHPPNRIGHDWVIAEFNSPVSLRAGVQHDLTLTAPPGDAYEIYPLRDGLEFGYSSPWPNAWAEYSSNGGKSWSGWDAWGKKDLKNSHLQLFFNG